MKRFLVFYFFGMILISTTAFADVYRCVSDDGVIKFSDEPCGKDAELIHDQPQTSLDEALSAEIEPFLRPYTSETYGKYITNQSKRIGRCILPDQWFNSSKLIRVYGPSPRDSYSFPKPKPIYGTTPGWVIFLYYGPESNPKKWSIEFRYISTIRKDINGILKSFVLLKSISIKKDEIPFTPISMRDVKKFEKKGTGEWKARL
jgi:hypothetical protein